jgi:hypothetical protein
MQSNNVPTGAVPLGKGMVELMLRYTPLVNQSYPKFGFDALQPGTYVTPPQTDEEIFVIDVLRDVETSTFAYLGRDADNRLILAFQGTVDLKQVETDLTFFKDTWPLVDPTLQCEFHSGFKNIVNNIAVPWLMKHVEVLAGKPTIQVLGHSLGGGLAQCMALYLSVVPKLDVICYVNGAPRVGNAASAALAKKQGFLLYNVMVLHDWVPNLPPEALGFMRWGQAPVPDVPLPAGGCFASMSWPSCDPSDAAPECGSPALAVEAPCCLSALTTNKEKSNCPAGWASNPGVDSEWCTSVAHVTSPNEVRHKCHRESKTTLPKQLDILVSDDLEDMYAFFVDPSYSWTVFEDHWVNHFSYMKFLFALYSSFDATRCTYHEDAVRRDANNSCGPGSHATCVAGVSGQQSCGTNGWCSQDGLCTLLDKPWNCAQDADCGTDKHAMCFSPGSHLSETEEVTESCNSTAQCSRAWWLHGGDKYCWNY